MTHPLLFALMALAAYRLTHFVTVDDLPLGRIRDWLEAKSKGGGWWARKAFEGSQCPWCAGSWIAFGTVAAVDWLTPVSLPLAALWWLGVACAVGLLGDWEG